MCTSSPADHVASSAFGSCSLPCVATAFPGHSMTGTGVDASELLDVDVDQLAGLAAEGRSKPKGAPRRPAARSMAKRSDGAQAQQRIAGFSDPAQVRRPSMGLPTTRAGIAASPADCGAGGASRGGMGGGGGGFEPGGGSRGASLGGLGMRAMFSLILVCTSPCGDAMPTLPL